MSAAGSTSLLAMFGLQVGFRITADRPPPSQAERFDLDGGCSEAAVLELPPQNVVADVSSTSRQLLAHDGQSEPGHPRIQAGYDRPRHPIQRSTMPADQYNTDAYYTSEASLKTYRQLPGAIVDLFA